MGLCGQVKRSGFAFCVVLWVAQETQAACEPWPGEPNPLPVTSSQDDFTARFAQLRAAELAALAMQLEPVAPGDAYRVWLHVACLAPERSDAQEGALRTAPVRIHTPEVVHGLGEAAVAAPDLASAFARLDDPVSTVSATRVETALKPVGAPPPRATPAPRGAPVAPPRGSASASPPLPVDRLLDEADGLIRQAHFEEALQKAEEARGAVPSRGDAAALRQRRVRADVIAGTAQVALGKEADARASFERAIQSDPNLRLDRATTSPKVVRAFDAARAAATGTGQ
jgi:hypothetical protein